MTDTTTRQMTTVIKSQNMRKFTNKHHERYIHGITRTLYLNDTKLISLQREMRSNEIKFYTETPLPHGTSTIDD